jgi:hypothetical protein
MPYGITKEFLFSGDLRLPLAQSPSEEDKQLLDSFIQKDSLLSLDEKGRSIQYNETFRNKRTQRLKELRISEEQYKGVHAGGCAVLCGAGWTRNAKFVEDAYKAGAVIISIGAGAYDNPWTQYWVGSCSPVDYPAEVLTKANMVRFTKEGYKDDRHFSARGTSFSGGPVSSYSGTVYLDTKDPIYRDILGDYEDNSLHMGLYLATHLGITDTVFAGIDMGTSPVDASKWYAGKLTIRKGRRDRQEVLYKDLVEDMENRLQNLLMVNYSMRLYAEGTTPFPSVSAMSSDKLVQAIKKRSYMGVSGYATERSNLTVAERVELADVGKVLRAGVMDAAFIIKHARGLAKKVPEVFDTDQVRKDIDQYDKLQRDPAGCTSCTAKSLGMQTLRLFIAAIQGEHRVKTYEYWGNHMRSRSCVQSQYTYIIPPWEESLSLKYNSLNDRK